MSSLRRQLLIGVLTPLLVVGVISACVVFLQAQHEASELLDYHMEQVASFLSAEPLESPAVSRFAPVNNPDSDSDDTLRVRITDRGGKLLFSSGEAPALPAAGVNGFTDLVAADGEEWRLFTLTTGDRIIRVLQLADEREDLGAASAFRVLVPILILIPLLAAMIFWLIARALRPLDQLAAAVSARDVNDLKSLPLTRVPAEVMPLMRELNSLLARLEVAVNSQRNFVADAAHALRTPLSAIQLQLQVIDSAPTPEERQRRQAQLKAGVARSVHLVTQLLSLARQENELLRAPHTTVPLNPLLQGVVADHAPLAEARQVSLALNAETDAVVRGDEAGLRVLFGNLVDNALRYTPPRGAVSLRVACAEGDGVLVEIADSGPGIADADLPRAFDRFYRGEATDVIGSGLGLSIVKGIADRHGAQVALRNRGDASGLVVSVRLQRAA